MNIDSSGRSNSFLFHLKERGMQINRYSVAKKSTQCRCHRYTVDSQNCSDVDRETANMEIPDRSTGETRYIPYRQNREIRNRKRLPESCGDVAE